MFGRDPYGRVAYGHASSDSSGTVLGFAALSAASGLSIVGGPILVSGPVDLSALSHLAHGVWQPWAATSSPTSGEPWNQSDSDGLGYTDLRASATLVAVGTISLYGGAASLSGAGTLTAGSQVVRVAAAALSASGTLAATSVLVASGGAGLTGTGTLAADAVRVILGASDASGTGTLAVDALLVWVASADLTAESNLEAIPYPVGRADLVADGSLVAVAVAELYAAADLSGSGLLTTAAIQVAIGAAALSASGMLVAAGALAFDGSATLSADGTLVAAGGLLISGLGLGFFSASSDLAVTAEVPLKAGFASLSGGSNLVASATAIMSGDSSLTSSGTLVAAGAHPVDGAASLSGSGTLTSTANLSRYVAAVALDSPSLWFDLGDPVGVFGRNRGSDTFFGSPITATYTGGARTASVIPTETTGSFDSNGTGYVSTFSNDMALTDLSFEIWFDTDTLPSAGTTRYIAYGGSGPLLFVGGTGKPVGRLRWQLNATIIETGVADDLANNTLYHIVGTYNTATGAMQLWVNTKLVASTSSSTINHITTDFQSIRIGNFSSNSLDGQAQQFAMYKNILTQAQIEAHYGAGTGVFVDRPTLSSRGDLVADGYSFDPAAAAVGEAHLSASSDLVAAGTPLAIWVAQTYSALSTLTASGTVIPQAEPSNDSVGNAITLTGANGSITFATRGATSSAPRSSGYNDPDVFFTWTAPFTGPVQFRIGPRDGDSPWFWDTEMEVYEGYPPNSTNFNNFDPDVTDPSVWGDYQVWGDNGEIYWPAIEGQTYTIVVVDYQNYPGNPPTQTEASLVWKMDAIPLYDPSGFGTADFMLFQDYFSTDNINDLAETGLRISVIRRNGASFSTVDTLKLNGDAYFPPADPIRLRGTSWYHAPCGTNRVVLHAIHFYTPQSGEVVGYLDDEYSAKAMTVTWDGTNLTVSAATTLYSDLMEDTYNGSGYNTDSELGVADWHVERFCPGVCTGDGLFWLAPQVRNLSNGKTYARWKYRMASFAIDPTTGALTNTGKYVDYTTGYDFSGGGDLLAPITWADPSRRWLPSGNSIDTPCSQLGAGEAIESSVVRVNLGGGTNFLFARLNTASDGTITRGDYFGDFTIGGADESPDMFDYVPGTRKLACFGILYPDSFDALNTDWVQVLDLDTFTPGPKAYFNDQELADWTDDGGNYTYAHRIGTIDGGFAIFRVKERPGSAFQAEYTIQPVTLSGNTVTLDGDYRILHNVIYGNDYYSQTDEGCLAVINDGVVFVAVEGAGIDWSEASIRGSAIGRLEGEGSEEIQAPSLVGDNEAVYGGTLLPIGATPNPNLAGLLTGQSKQFGRGRAGL